MKNVLWSLAGAVLGLLWRHRDPARRREWQRMKRVPAPPREDLL